MKMIKNKSFFTASITILLVLAVAIILNYNSLGYAKEACVDNNKTPKMEQDFLAFNWSVSCE